jgi:hypothetical protein
MTFLNKIFIFIFINSTYVYAQNEPILMQNSVYYITDTLSEGEYNNIVLFTYYKFINKSEVFISLPSPEKPTLENTMNLSTDKGYYGSVKAIKNNMIKIVCKKGIFHRTREKFFLDEKKLRLVYFVNEGMLFFQWRKPKQEFLFFLLEN